MQCNKASLCQWGTHFGNLLGGPRLFLWFGHLGGVHTNSGSVSLLKVNFYYIINYLLLKVVVILLLHAATEN